MIARQIATVGGVGFLPWGPGTWGSAVAIPMAWLLHWAGGFFLLLAATWAVGIVGVIVTHAYLNGREDDPKEVVIDEVVGQWIALWPLSFGLMLGGSEPHVFPWPGWIGAFVLFRFFDILKPPPIRWLDRPNAIGIMLDDVAAGVMAAAVLFLTAGVSHGWF